MNNSLLLFLYTKYFSHFHVIRRDSASVHLNEHSKFAVLSLAHFVLCLSFRLRDGVVHLELIHYQD